MSGVIKDFKKGMPQKLTSGGDFIRQWAMANSLRVTGSGGFLV